MTTLSRRLLLAFLIAGSGVGLDRPAGAPLAGGRSVRLRLIMLRDKRVTIGKGRGGGHSLPIGRVVYEMAMLLI